MSFLHFLAFLSVFGNKLVNSADPQVQLPNGLIIGREAVTLKNKVFYAFEKIPYATPPVGNLRFQPPIPPSNWDEPLETKDMDVTCFQQGFTLDEETEDCLYVNVFTPELPDADKNVSLPVMFYIHGGGFVALSGRHVYGDRFIDEDIVFVAINYRLGPFGFLSTEDEIVPGNNGLKDQHLALQWAHDNIHLFGGDPDKITIFGQSAGSASCAYHLINQASRGAILQSGSFLSPWAYQRRARKIAFQAASFLNDTFATNDNSQDLLEYLQSLDAKVLDDLADTFHDFESSAEDMELFQGFYWAPVIEVKNPDAFLTRKMYGLLQAGNIVPVPILLGITSEESLLFYQDPSSLREMMSQYDENLAWLVPNDMGVSDSDERTEIGRQIRDIYTSGGSFADNLGPSLRYCSDNSFTRSLIRHAELYSNFADAYFYEFSYDGQIGHINNNYEGVDNVGHGQENYYLFCGGTDCDLSNYPDLDQLMQERMVRIWTNFAKYQNPTPEADPLLQNITWPQVSTENGDFYFVNINGTLEIQNHPKDSSYGKWVDIYNSLNVQDFDTY